MQKLLFLFFLFITPMLTAQDHRWWADNVGWDGSSHWREYLIQSARFQGPNALPIPPMNTARVDSSSFLELNAHHWRSPGDRTWNPELLAQYTILPGKLSFRLAWIPVEYFQTTHEWKTRNKVFHIDYDARFSTGDIYLYTALQLWNEVQHALDVNLRVTYRFPTSDLIGAARFTDSPLYVFDAGIAKRWGSLRPHLMLGFMAWQTNRDDQVQNDAFVYGLGLSWVHDALTIQLNNRGYFGYLDNGDKPMLSELQLDYQLSRWTISLKGGVGANDFLYDFLTIGGKLYL